ncbi:MAG: fibronectin type III domain-containing protein, partial [Bacteroidales bacterium]|nr:fibronectin type III domain-containing protein [Bacteroidales bacterium]
MEQTIPVFAMKGSAERAVETKNQHLGTKLTRKARYLLTAMLLSLAGVSSTQAQQCDDWYQSTTDDPSNYFFVEDSLVGHVALHTEAGEVANYNPLVYYITNTSTNETYRYENTDIYDFTITDLPEGTYSWSVRGICVSNGDSTSLLNIRNFTVVSCYPATGTLSFASDTQEFFPPCSGGGITFQDVTNTTNKNGTYSIDDNTIGTVMSTSPKFTSSGVPGSATITYSVTTDPNECDIPPASFTIVVKSFIVIDSVKVVPSCDLSTADITVHASVNPEATCSSSWQYTINNTQENNTTGTFTDVPYYDSYNITITHTTSGFTYDTIVATPVRTTCGALIDEGSSTEWWWGYSDRDMEGNNPGFYVACNVQCVGWNTGSNVLDSVESFEVWYKHVDDSEWRTIVRSAGESWYNVRLDRKGVWEWKARTLCCGGVPGPWSTTVYETYYFIDDPEDNDVVVTPICSGNDGSISVKMGDISELYYVVYDENDTPVSDTLKPTLQSDVSTLTFSNISQPGNYTIKQLLRGYDNPPTYYFTYLDTTLYVPAVTSCDITATGTPSLTILDYSYEDYENSGNFGEFYYRLEIPSVDGTPESIEVQYGLVGSDSPSSVYYNPSTGAGSIKIPITAKGDWEVKMRARCCGGSFPGNIPGDWFLIDTIHHYPNFAISTEGYCYRIPPAQSENGSVSMTFNPPHNVSSNTSEMRVRIFPVDNSSDIKYDGSGTSGAIELADLSEGDYKVYVYINDGTDENTFNAYLDTSFTIGNRFKVAIQNDSSSICATDSVLYRAIVTGGTEPYDFEWVAYETSFGQFDDSVWVNFDIASSDDPGVTVTDADGCFSSTEIHVNLLPAYTQATDYYYDSYTYSRNRYIITNQLPFTLQDFTFDGSETSASHEFNFQTVNGCDSIVNILFTQKPGIALPSSGNLDTTITTGVDVYDDGGLSSAAALHADRTLTLHAPEGNTLELQLTGTTFNLGEGEALYVYDYNGVNDNALLFEYRQGMNPPNMDFTSNSRSLTIRYVTGNSCAQGFMMTVVTKDISNECLPVYNVTSTTEMTAATWVRCNMQWEYSGVADSFEVKYVGLKWNDAEAKLDTINGPVTEYTTSNSIQIGCYNNLGIENCQIAVRAICGVGDTSEACLHSFIPFSPLIIPHTGDTLVVLDSTISTIALYDEGGVDGSYSDEADGSLTVKAADGYELIIAQSSAYDLEENYDFLYITDDYAGTATNTYLLDTLNGEGGTIESHMYSHSDGFKFTLLSDGSQTKDGVNFTIYQVKLDQCRQPYNPKAERRLMDITPYYVITDAGAYGANVGDLVKVKKTNVATNAITYDTLALEMGDNAPVLSIEPPYTMDVQLATLCGYSTTPVWSEPMRLSACVAPVGVSAVSPATTNSIDIQLDTYTEADRYLVSYHVSGSNSWLDTVVTSSTFTLQNLAPSSNYEVRAASICGVGDTSDFSNSITLNTQCGYRPGVPDGYNELSSIPDAFDFENVETGAGIYNMPDCWTRIEYTDNSTSRTYPYVATIDEDNDNIYNALVFDAGSSQDQVAILPKFDFTGSNPEDWIINFTSRATNLDGEACEDPGLIINFGYITDPNDASTFTTLNTTQATASFEMHTNCSLYGLASYPDAYPAFKVTYSGNNLNKHLLLKDIQILPNYTNSGSYPQPSNVKITKHPSQENKMVITWDCDELTNIDSDDNVTVQYRVEVQRSLNNSSLSNTTLTVDQKQAVIDVEPGMYVYARVSLFVSSRKYAAFSPWMGPRSEADETIVPIANKQAVDTIGDISNRGTMSQSAPFYYGGSAIAEMIVTSDEIKNISAVSAIAFRMEDANSCDVEGFQNVDIYMKEVSFSEFSSSGTNGNYTIDDFADYQLEESDRISSAYVTPYERGWLMIKMNATFSHDPYKNLLIAIVSNAGDATDGQTDKTYFELDEASDGKCLSITGSSDFSSLAQTQTVNPVTMRPQMMLFEDKNCTPEMNIDTVQVCENDSYEWRGMTISFDDTDSEVHHVKDSVWDDGYGEWNYSDAWVYNDTVANAADGGTCDSIYQLRIGKLDMDRDGATPFDSYPNAYQTINVYTATSCGPYTWTDGKVYTESTGYYWDEDATPGCAGYLQYADELHYDTIEGGSQNGCDRIAILSLQVEPYFTVIFDTSNVDAGSAMAPQYICDADSYAVPSCTMSRNHYDFGGWLYDGDTLFRNDPIEAETGDTILLTPLWEVNCGDGFIADEDYQDFCVLNSNYTWRGHTITLDYLKAHGYYNEVWLTGEENDDIPYIYVDDTLSLAVDGVCDSIYRLKVRMEDRMELTDYYSDDSYWDVCSLGFTWSDGNHYTADTGWYWWSDPDDNDNYAYATLDISIAPMWIDSTANSGCGTLHVLGMAVDDTLPGITVYYVKYYEENAIHLDTLWSMTTSVCEGVDYTIPNMPDTVTREGYDFVQWTDNPACGWTVEPGVAKRISTDWDFYVFYGMWESNCSDTTVYDTVTLCSNDTITSHGFTWRGPEFQVGVFDTIVSQIGVIPGECDSIFRLNIAVPDIPTLSVDTVINVSCSGGSNGEISTIVPTIVNAYEYNLTYQFKLDTSEYSTAYNSPNYGWSNLMAGEHKVYVKDGCGLMDSTTVTITEPEQINVNVTSYSSEGVCYSTDMVKQLNASATGGNGIYTYVWNNNATRNYDTLMVSLNVPGTFHDTVIVTDSNGCTGMGTYTYTVYDTLKVTVNGGDTSYCKNAPSVPLTVTVTGGDTNSGYTYQWTNYGNDISGETTNSYTVATTNAAEFDGLSVTITNVCGEKVVQAPVITVLDSLRLVAYTNDATLCFGANTAQMEVDVQGGGAFTGQWYMNGTAVTDHNPGDADNKYTPRTDTAGTFNYSLKVTSNAGCGS